LSAPEPVEGPPTSHYLLLASCNSLLPPKFSPHILRTNRTLLPIVASRRTILSAEVDHLQVKGLPFLFRNQPFEVAFCLGNALTIRQSPSIRKSMYVGVDGKGGLSEPLGHDYRS